MVSHPARSLALVFCLAVVLGGSLPDLGNLATIALKIPDAHYFNFPFMVVGIVGFVICSIALCRRLRRDTF